MTITIHRQRGAALLIFFVIMFSAAAAVILRALNNVDIRQTQSLDTHQDILTTKELLLASTIAWSDYDLPAGRFPCPDTNNDGLPEASPCNAATMLGRLPVSFDIGTGAKVDLGNTGQATDQRYWYAVNREHRSVVEVVNSATSSSLRLDVTEEVIAVLIAPGAALPGQNRNNKTTASNYLESTNAGGTNFVSSWPDNPSGFNDRVVPIYRHEVMTLVTARVAAVMKSILDEYHVLNPTIGYPADPTIFGTTISAKGGWLVLNNWHLPAVTTYTRVDSNNVNLKFKDCGITYTLTHDDPTIQRSQRSC